MRPMEEKSVIEMRQYVMQLRYRLAQYQFNGVAPPVTLLIELKMAERLMKLELTNTIRVNVKV